MKEIFKSKVFGTMFILASAVVFIALLNLNQVYQSETDVLIIPKSAPAISNSAQIIENLRKIPYSLSFYNKLVQNNPDVQIEAISELPDYKKKTAWDEKIEIERSKNTGIIMIKVSDKSQYQAEILSGQISKDLIRTASAIYNIKDDIDIRIIDGPITLATSQKPVFTLILESFLGGFISVLISFFIPFWMFGKKSSQKYFDKKVYSWPENRLSETSPQEIWQPAQKFPSSSAKKAFAPDNLPIAPISEESKDKIKKDEGTPIIREATPEEVKERLNMLLSGKL
jgi:capsular polysaccharide biosynthesis protein